LVVLGVFFGVLLGVFPGVLPGVLAARFRVDICLSKRHFNQNKILQYDYENVEKLG
jgi:hypothetical protein